MTVPKINSAHGSDTRNILNRAIETLNRLGIDVQTLVAEGQLTPSQYAELITVINGLIKSGHVDKSVLTPEFKDEIEGFNVQLAQTMQQKADRLEVFLKENGININDFDEPTRQTFLEQQGIDVNYVLGDGNVTPRNTTFLTKVEEVNEIAKAIETTSVNDFNASQSAVLLKDHNITGSGTVSASSTFNVLKLPVKPNDIIRSKVYFNYNKRDSTAGLYYINFFRADGSFLSTFVVKWAADTSTNLDTVKANGVTVPDDAAFCHVAIANRYYYNNDISEATNGKKAEIITVNRNSEITNYAAETPIDDYVPIGDDHYLFDNDVKIPRYDNKLQGIEDILASLVDVGGN